MPYTTSEYMPHVPLQPKCDARSGAHQTRAGWEADKALTIPYGEIETIGEDEQPTAGALAGAEGLVVEAEEVEAALPFRRVEARDRHPEERPVMAPRQVPDPLRRGGA